MKMTVSIKVNTLGFEPGEVGAVPARSTMEDDFKN